MTDNVLDRAMEWVGENYPELTGKEFEDKLADVINDISAIDDEKDKAYDDRYP